LLCAAPALALVGNTQGAIGLDGSVRTITAATINYSSPLFEDRADGVSDTLLRLIVAGRPSSWLSYELHGVQELYLSTARAIGPAAMLAGGVPSSYRFTDASWVWGETEDVRASLWLDRLSVKLSAPKLDVTLGRQAITFGKAHFWNPLDVFLAFDPRQFDREYKPGVDAARVDVYLGEAAGISVVGAIGRTGVGNEPGATWYGTSILGRAYANAWNWDFTAQGGKVRGGMQVGAAAAGEIGPVGVTAEAAAFFPLPEETLLGNHAVATAGASYRFGFGLNVEAAYLYNGAGDASNLLRALQRVIEGRSYHMSEHLLGLFLGYDELPLLKISLGYVLSFSDFSQLIQPSFELSISDEADLLFGALIGIGARPDGVSLVDPGLRSEFGTYPAVVYGEFRYHF
jgi:hypothetical protein